MKFSVAHARDGAFAGAGLRDFFEYRDLGIAAATDGRVGAHVIRARKLLEEPGALHHHTLDAQLVYVLRGWIKFDYEGVGEVLLEAGSCVHQPPGIRHTELGHSDDVEMLEITLPATFGTVVDP
ncbi:MAG: hypothetical protein NVS3B28_26490 [Candidatus Velthaea sp.]